MTFLKNERKKPVGAGCQEIEFTFPDLLPGIRTENGRNLHRKLKGEVGRSEKADDMERVKLKGGGGTADGIPCHTDKAAFYPQ